MNSNSFIRDKVETALLERFISGDMKAFSEIYEIHYNSLKVYGLKYLEKEEVEDCIQSLFLKFLQNRDSLKQVLDIKAYLLISLRNNIYKRLKKRFNKVEISNNELIIIDEEFDRSESLIFVVLNFLKTLSPRENQIVQMKYFEGYKNIEIAEQLQIDYQTVRNIQVNAIRKLRQIPYSR
jgi:RNA polymerase sigma factor (sigma-70 family)